MLSTLEILKHDTDQKLLISSPKHIIVFLLDRLKAFKSNVHEDDLIKEIESIIDRIVTFKDFFDKGFNRYSDYHGFNIMMDIFNCKLIGDVKYASGWFIGDFHGVNHDNLLKTGRIQLEKSSALGEASIRELVAQLKSGFDILYGKFFIKENHENDMRNQYIKNVIYSIFTNINDIDMDINQFLVKFIRRRNKSSKILNADNSKALDFIYIDSLDIENGELIIKKMLITPQALSFINKKNLNN